MHAVTTERQEYRRRRIVVATRNSREALVLSVLLQRFDYDVHTARDAEHAGELARSQRPDLVIAEASPPGTAARDVLQIVHDDPRTAQVPVVLLVPLSDAAAESRGLGRGATACITRPVQAEELYRTVQELIEPHPRTNIRIDAAIDVEVNGAPLVHGAADAVDLSTYGMFIPTDAPLPRNRLIALRLHIRNRTIDAQGSVLFSHTAAAGSRKASGMGLKFTAIEADDRDFISQYIRDEVMHGIPSSPPFGG